MHWLVARHAAYVLAAYGISAVVLMGLVLHTLFSARRWRRAVAAREQKPLRSD